MKEVRPKGQLSIVMVPAGGGKARSFNLGRRGMTIAVIVAAAALCLFIFVLGAVGRMGQYSLTISRLKRENAELRDSQKKLGKLEEELAQLRAVERRLASLVGIEQKGGAAEGAGGQTHLLASRQEETFDYSGSSPTLWPVRGAISRGFSEKKGGHKGIDIAVARETPVRAAGDGTVDFAGEDDVFGSMIIINHGSGISSLYGHNSGLTAARGETVRKGQIIAYSGNSGRSSAPHLHFEISRYGRQVDPLTFLREQ
jgi:murein DD-endopeptidase MepM/ murein hydrolase activator NlpD